MNPQIKGQNSENLNTQSDYNNFTTGGRPSFNATSSSGFYTTKVSGLTIASIAVSGSNCTYTFSGTPDLSEVMVGNFLSIALTTDVNNSGSFEITAINDGADTLIVTNTNGVAQAGAAGKAETLPFGNARAIYGVTAVTDFDSLVEDNCFLNATALAAQPLAVNGWLWGDFSEIIPSDGLVKIYSL